jgi:hypothetical protein
MSEIQDYENLETVNIKTDDLLNYKKAIREDLTQNLVIIPQVFTALNLLKSPPNHNENDPIRPIGESCEI